MDNFLVKENITFVITTFRSRNTIFNCLDTLDPKCKKIIIENSNDENLMKEIKSKYQNIKYKVMPSNYGYGKANNVGINLSNTDYVFILNPDTKFEKQYFDKFINILNNKNFTIAAPTEVSEITKMKFNEDNLINVDFVKGFAMLLKKKNFNNNFFDENFFLYLEEIDLCVRVKKNKENIVLINAPILHLGGLSHGNKGDFEMEKSRNWHWMWSRFYYYKKHHGYLYGLLLTIPKFFLSLIKYIFYITIKKKNKSEKYKMRFLGLFNSYILKKSYYRPYDEKY